MYYNTQTIFLFMLSLTGQHQSMVHFCPHAKDAGQAENEGNFGTEGDARKSAFEHFFRVAEFLGGAGKML